MFQEGMRLQLVSNHFFRVPGKLPKIIVLHIKRFDSNYRKIEKKTEYGAMLDLEQFCAPKISPQLRGQT